MEGPLTGVVPGDPRLTKEENKSVTHGEFWIPEEERGVYQEALRALNAAGVPYVISGLYAIYEYTGIYRQTKDLDLFFQPEHILEAARVLKAEGFRTHLEQPHWLAKVFKGDILIDMIFGMGNGLAFIDDQWYRHSRSGILAATTVRVAPPEELLWHRLFVSERHRYDMADIVHLILTRGDQLDWERIIARTGEHWRLLLAQIHLFDYSYPGRRGRIPNWVREELFERAYEGLKQESDPDLCQGTMISRFSFAIDVNEWGFHNVREDHVIEARDAPIIREVRDSDVWDSHSDHAAR